MVHKGQRYKNVYKANIMDPMGEELSCLGALMGSSLLWHKRISHASFSYLNKLVESTQEDIEEIDMELTTNPEGEPGTQDEGTQGEKLNTSIMLPNEQGVSPNTAQNDTMEAPELMTSQNSPGDEPDTSQVTEQQARH
ncbi:hypothetical protein HAX54_047815 [Datura stramonium]|uniref:GAG-pre-integrase domain-containing protein n=1 Tax=Datura stramonium TaxID=4076 RepID=A0ABS8SUE8_DATST|nr:hypothetical protein [Datura stramonium]